MEPEYLYPDCPEMPEEVCIQCPMYDHLLEECSLLTDSLRCGTIVVSLSLEKKGGTQ